MHLLEFSLLLKKWQIKRGYFTCVISESVCFFPRTNLFPRVLPNGTINRGFLKSLVVQILVYFPKYFPCVPFQSLRSHLHLLPTDLLLQMLERPFESGKELEEEGGDDYYYYYYDEDETEEEDEGSGEEYYFYYDDEEEEAKWDDMDTAESLPVPSALIGKEVN